MNVSTFVNLLLPHIAEMAPYTPIQPFEVLSRELGRAPEQIVKLDANENPYGPHPAVREALARYPFYHIYPDPEQRELRAALAEYTGVPAANIFPGHGADELIDLISRLFLGPGDAIINCSPTFGMYEFDAGLADAHVVPVPRRADFSVDVGRIRIREYDVSESERLRSTRPSSSSSPRPTTRTAACWRMTTCGACSTCP